VNVIERHICEYIGENPDNPDVFIEGSNSLDNLRSSINDAIDEVNMVLGDWKQTYSIPLRAKSMFYRLDFGLTGPRFGWIYGAWYRPTKRRLEQTHVSKLMIDDPLWLSRTGTPWQYAPIGLTSVMLYPGPSASGGVVDLECVIIPERYNNDEDRVFLRDSWKLSVVHYVVSEFWASRGDAESADSHHNKYLELMNLMNIVPRYGERRWALSTDKKGRADELGKS
jgi:hypothetical protein